VTVTDLPEKIIGTRLGHKYGGALLLKRYDHSQQMARKVQF
jgi:hypothetical protein